MTAPKTLSWNYHYLSLVFLNLCLVSAAEELTLESFKLLTEDDLSKLGFKMGPRKLLLQWITQQSAGMAFVVNCCTCCVLIVCYIAAVNGHESYKIWFFII